MTQLSRRTGPRPERIGPPGWKHPANEIASLVPVHAGTRVDQRRVAEAVQREQARPAELLRHRDRAPQRGSRGRWCFRSPVRGWRYDGPTVRCRGARCAPARSSRVSSPRPRTARPPRSAVARSRRCPGRRWPPGRGPRRTRSPSPAPRRDPTVGGGPRSLLPQLLQGVCLELPVGRQVEGADRSRDRLRVGRLTGLPVHGQPLEQVGELLPCRLGAPGGERAACGVRSPAQVEKGPEGLGRLDVRHEARPTGQEAPAVALQLGARPCDRVDHAVERHRPNPTGEHVRVDGADDGPVGRADVVHRALAGSPAHQVKVADGVDRETCVSRRRLRRWQRSPKRR